MGLIKAAVDAVQSTLGDQWEDYINCESLDNNTLVVKKTTKTGQISAKSRIQVNPGQVAIIFDSGKILDATAEEGIYTFDASSSPSLFAGQFGEVFKETWQRFTYNGTPAKEQAIYYVNIKEILDNKFGSSSPIPYDDPLYHDIRIRYHGTYSFKVSNPLTFFSKVVGNVTDVYTKEQLLEQADAEFLSCIAGAIGKCAVDGIKYSYLSQEQVRIAEYMNDALDEKWINLRGIEVVSVALDTPTPDEKSQERIEKFGDARVFSNQEMATGRMVAAQAQALENASSNENGAAAGFMGLGMMNMAGASMTANMPMKFADSTPAQPAATVATAAPSTGIKCANCGSVVEGKFCSNCGTKVEEAEAPAQEVKCPNCGAIPAAGSKFCTECGTQLN